MQEARKERSAVYTPGGCGLHFLGISTSGAADAGSREHGIGTHAFQPASATTLLCLSEQIATLMSSIHVEVAADGEWRRGRATFLGGLESGC